MYPVSGRRFLLLFVYAFLSVLASYGQINEADTSGFQSRLVLTGNMQQGNVDLVAIRARADAAFRTSGNLVWKTQNNLLWQVFNGRKADLDLFSRNYLYLHPEKKGYPFIIGFMSKNYRRRIDERLFAGPGFTWRPVNKADHVWKCSMAMVCERSAFRDTLFSDKRYNGRSSISLTRLTVYTGGWSYLLKRKLRFLYDLYVQPAATYFRNYRVQADLGLDWPLSRQWSFSVNYSYGFENVVPLSVRRRDAILSFGMSAQIRKKMQGQVNLR